MLRRSRTQTYECRGIRPFVGGERAPDCLGSITVTFPPKPLAGRDRGSASVPYGWLNRHGQKLDTAYIAGSDLSQPHTCKACDAITRLRNQARHAVKVQAENERRREVAKVVAAKQAAKQLRQEAMRRTHNHVRRSRELQAPGEHSTAEWLLKLQEFGHRCAYCGTEGADFHRDHLVPLVDGGSNSIGNIVPACPSCNLSKGGKSGAALLLWITERRAVAGRAA
jgi:5-methylcytosine-specific restriction endonuclease McrA